MRCVRTTVSAVGVEGINERIYERLKVFTKDT